MYYLFRPTCSRGQAGISGYSELKEWLSSFHPYTILSNVERFPCITGGSGLSLHQVTPLVLLAYIQYLTNASLSESNISTNLAAMRAFHIIHGLSKDAFQDRQIPLLLKSITINRPLAPQISQGFSIERLHQVIAISAGLEHNVTFMALYSFVFFSFLRLSNLLPHTSKQYGCTRHMARGTSFFHILEPQ